MKTRDLENTLNNVHDQKSLTQYTNDSRYFLRFIS